MTIRARLEVQGQPQWNRCFPRLANKGSPFWKGLLSWCDPLEECWRIPLPMSDTLERCDEHISVGAVAICYLPLTVDQNHWDRMHGCPDFTCQRGETKVAQIRQKIHFFSPSHPQARPWKRCVWQLKQKVVWCRFLPSHPKRTDGTHTQTDEKRSNFNFLPLRRGVDGFQWSVTLWENRWGMNCMSDAFHWRLSAGPFPDLTSTNQHWSISFLWLLPSTVT